MGSNGEAVHLTRAERALVTQNTRSALDEAGFKNVPVIAGASDQSIRGTIELCREAADAGAEYVLTIAPSFYRAAMGNEETLYKFFTSVAEASPLPLILYNYPGAVAGIDMDSDLIVRLSQHPNIVGTKFTCGNTGKLSRVARAMNAITMQSPLVKSIATSESSSYAAFGGFADFALQTLVSGGTGVLAGGANVLPRLCVEVFNLWGKGQLEEAMEMQKILSEGDWVLSKSAIPGTKSAIQSYYGYGGYPRRPLGRLTEEQSKAVAEGIKEAMGVEMCLKDVA